MSKQISGNLVKAPTMADIAQKLGVTKMTVSYALSGNTRISQETREMVLRTAKEMGYRPNAVAQSLKRRRTNILGLYSGLGYLDARNVFYAEVIGGAQKGCEKSGQDLLVHGTFRERSAEEICQEVENGKIDGLLVLQPSPELVKLLVKSHLPVVALSDAVEQLPSVVVDNAAGSRLLAQHLTSLGYRHVVYRRRVILPSTEIRFQSFKLAAQELGMKVKKFTHQAVWASDDDIYYTVEKEEQEYLLAQIKKGRTAVVAEHDDAVPASVEFCYQAGLRVPEDVGFAGFGGMAKAWPNQPRLTTIRAPWAQMSEVGVALLLDQIEGKATKALTILPVELIAGDTT